MFERFGFCKDIKSYSICSILIKQLRYHRSRRRVPILHFVVQTFGLIIKSTLHLGNSNSVILLTNYISSYGFQSLIRCSMNENNVPLFQKASELITRVISHLHGSSLLSPPFHLCLGCSLPSDVPRVTVVRSSDVGIFCNVRFHRGGRSLGNGGGEGLDVGLVDAWWRR